MATLFQLPKTVPISGGNSYSGAKAYFYQSGTTTAITTYTTAALSVPHANPVVADANGVFAPIFIDDSTNPTYKLRLNTSSDVLIYEVDNLPAARGTARTDAEIAAGVTVVNDSYDPGWVLRYFSGTVGTTDATPAIQAALDQGAQTNGALPYSEETHYINGSSKIVIKSNCDFSKSTWNIDNAPAVAVEISTGSATNPTDLIRNLDCKLPILVNSDKPATGWASQGTALRLVNVYQSHIYLQRITNFDTGLLLAAYGSVGCVYNNIHIKAMDNNKRQIRLAPQATTAWVNENNFFGGSCIWNSGEGTNISGVRGVLHEHFSGGNLINNNRCWGMSLEGDGPEYHLEEQGVDNSFLYCRWEATPPKVYINATPAATTLSGLRIIGGYAPVTGIVTTIAGTAAGNSILGVGQRHGQGFLDQGFALANNSSDTNPIFRVYGSSTFEPWEKETAATDWLWSWTPQNLNGKNSGDSVNRVALDAVNGRVYIASGVLWASGTGSPENVLTAPIGSIYSRTDGGAGTSFYVKESGSGNTGWVAK